MGDEAFDAGYAAGRALDLDQVMPMLERTHAAVPGAAASVLTPRELDVLKLVAQGLSNPDIARRLVLSEHTVHRHLANILRKLDLSSRAAAAAWATRAGCEPGPIGPSAVAPVNLARTGDAMALRRRISLVQVTASRSEAPPVRLARRRRTQQIR